jgi:hypothetical protein
VRKRIEATGDSKASARRRLFATLGEAMAAGGLGYSPRSMLADVAADCLESLASWWQRVDVRREWWHLTAMR